MNIIEKRRRRGFWNPSPPPKETIILNDDEKAKLIRDRSIVVERPFGRFRISVPPNHIGDLTPDVIETDHLPRIALIRNWSDFVVKQKLRPYFKELRGFLDNEYRKHRIYPPLPKIFRDLGVQ